MIAGNAADASGIPNGFVLPKGGYASTFEVNNTFTTVTGINKAGAISGYDEDGSGEDHGFVRTSASEVTSFDAPGVAQGWAFAVAINSKGAVAGYYVNSTGPSWGFIRNP